MTFTGFPVAALDFYDDLELDNSRTFWLANKGIYDESVRAPIVELMAELEPEFGPAKVFRPHRDVRFAKDKTPYKTNQGAVVGDGAGGGALYMHISAPGLFVAGGYWQMASDQIARYRRAVADDIAGAELERRLTLVRKAKLEIGGSQLTRVPSGYDKDHPRAELLRHKSLTASREFGTPEWLQTPRAKSEIVRAWRSMEPLNDWLEAHVGPAEPKP
jgi:uncharacterized protein (TIGR02453 family)